MNIVQRIINLGTAGKTDPTYIRHIRFANSVALIVCLFIIQCSALTVYYKAPIFIFIYIVHFILIAFIPFINYRGKHILASAWFSTVAILFVTFYSIAFQMISYNFVFLPMIIFLQFFLFSATEKKYIILFIIIIAFCLAAVILLNDLNVPIPIPVPAGFLRAQRLNSLIGIPLLSIGFGAYAWSTINKAEKEVAHEKEKTEKLLLNILPKSIAERFKNDQSFFAQGYASVTVLFADLVGFTKLSAKITPNELVILLNDVFSRFDELTEAYGLEKIKTIGDSYMVAGGVPAPSDDHILKTCRLALDIQQSIKQVKVPGGEPLHIRIGISTGPVTAGVIGARKFIYDLWGDTVNTASRMESHAEEGSIQITEDVYLAVKNELDCRPRGTIDVKGKGEMVTYFLAGVKR